MPVLNEQGQEVRPPDEEPPLAPDPVRQEPRPSTREVLAAKAPDFKLPEPPTLPEGLIGRNLSRRTPLTDAIETVEKATKGTLATDVVIDLAGLQEKDEDLADIARRLSNDLSVPPRYLFGQLDPNLYVNPVTGEPITMKELRRYANQFDPVAIAAILKSVQHIRTGKGRGGQGVVERDVVQVGKLAQTLAEVYGRMPATVGISLAVVLYDRGVTPSGLRNSADAVRSYMSSIGAPDTRDVFIGYIAALASTTNNVRSPDDVVRYLFGGDALKARDHVADMLARRGELEAGTATIPASPGAARGRTETPAPVEDSYLYAGSTESIDRGITNYTAQFGSGFASIAPDLWPQVAEIQGEVKLRQEAFSKSVAGRVLHDVGAVFNQTWEWTNQGLIQLGTGLLGAGVGVVGGVGGALGIYEGEDIEAAFKRLGQLNNYAFQRIKDGDTVGDFVTEGYGLPSWMAPIIDFGVGWYVDPFVVAGKAAQFARAGRVVPELLQSGLIRTAIEKVPGIGKAAKWKREADLLQAKARFTRYVTEVLPKSRLSDRLFSAVYKGETEYLRTIDSLYGLYSSRGVFDLEYMSLLRKNLIERFPTASAEARQAFGDALTAHYVGWGPEGSVAANVVSARLKAMREAEVNLTDLAAKPPTGQIVLHQGREFEDIGGLIVPRATPEEVISGLIREQTGGWHAPFSIEAPSSGFFAELGPRRLTRRIVTSQPVTSTGAGRRGARLISLNPGRIMNIESGADEYMLLHARRWGQFDEATVRGYQAEALAIRTKGWQVERQLGLLIDRINDAGMRSLAERYNIADDTVKELKKVIFDPVTNQNGRKRVFGFTDEAVDVPILESQLRNTLLVADPIDVLRQVRQYVGFRRRFMDGFLRAVGKDLPEVAAQLGNPTVIRAYEKLFGLGRAWRRGWKAYVVARPAYIPRVILGDENARFLATTQSISERLLSQRLNSPLLGRIGTKLDESGVFDDIIEIGDDVIRIKRPGALDFAYDAAATGRIRESELVTEAMRHAKDLHKASSNGLISWDVLRATEKEADHLSAWVWALDKQFRNSGPGKLALESVEAGDSVTTTTRKLINWAREDHYVTLTSRIGRPASEVSEWADQLARMAHGYTMGDARIAGLALRGERRALAKALEGVKVADRPPVHGPTIADALTTAEGKGAREFTNWLYRVFVRQPEDILNRQPFYRVWKRRAERGYYRMLEDSGVGGRVVDAAELARAQSLADDYRKVIQWVSGREDYYKSLGRADTKGDRALKRVSEEIRAGDMPSDVEESWRRIAPTTVDQETQEVFRLGDVEYPRTGTLLDVYQSQDVVLEDLEKALAGHSRGVTPAMRQQIDVASREFALGQVRRIMFDFTKQSRFTELLQMVFPFPQPFFEGFQAWGHIAWRNPEAIGRAMTLYRTAKDSGFITKDPVTGEEVVGMGVYVHAARLLSALGVRGESDWWAHNMSFVSGLASFNMLASTTLKLPSDGILGRLVGGMPVPVPGLDPAAGRVLQQMFKGTTNETLASWLFQYGPSTPILPNTIAAVLSQFYPEAIDQLSGQKYLDRYALALEEFWQANGLDVKPGGEKMTSEEIALEARKQAAELYQTQKLLSLFSPASLRVNFGTGELQTEWQNLLDTSASWEEAKATWDERHPDLTLIPLSRTFYSDPEASAAQGIPVRAGYGEGQGAPRLPASEFVALMFAQPGIGEFMRRNPEWAALALVGSDETLVNAQNFGVYSSQLASGLVSYKDPLKFWEEGENAKAWTLVDKFYKETWNAGMDRVERENLDTQDDFYQGLIQARQTAFLDIALAYPSFAKRYFEPQSDPETGEVIGWDWAGRSGDGVPIELIVRDARRIAALKEFRNFPGFQALGLYLEGRDEIAADMAEAGVRTLDPESETAAPFLARYEALVTGIITDTPQMEPFLTSYFGVRFDEAGKLYKTDDLMNLPSDRQLARRRIASSASGAALLQAADVLDTEIEKARDAATSLEGVMVPSDKSQRYLDAQHIVDSADPNVLKTWWAIQSESDRRDYIQGLITKPMVFYSTFDWKLAGVKLSSKARTWMDDIAQARVEIQRLEEEDPVGFSKSEGYEAIDIYVRQHLDEDKSFRKAIERINDWTAPITLGGYTELPGKTGRLWSEFADGLRAVQAAADKLGWTGINYGKDAERQAWKEVKDVLLVFVDKYRANPGFRESWDELQKQYQDPLIGGLFFPDDYFKLGSVEE